jgi:hypothetical protein
MYVAHQRTTIFSKSPLSAGDNLESHPIWLDNFQFPPFWRNHFLGSERAYCGAELQDAAWQICCRRLLRGIGDTVYKEAPWRNKLNKNLRNN